MTEPSSTASRSGGPVRHLSVFYVVMLAVAMVVGAGIFKSPALVAQEAGSPFWLFAAWIIGGFVTLIGALCYAELATAFPNAGGDYHFLRLAYGRTTAFLFAWARFTVTNSGSIALLGYVLGDYLNIVLPLGPMGSPIYAALVDSLFQNPAPMLAGGAVAQHSGKAVVEMHRISSFGHGQGCGILAPRSLHITRGRLDAGKLSTRCKAGQLLSGTILLSLHCRSGSFRCKILLHMARDTQSDEDKGGARWPVSTRSIAGFSPSCRTRDG